MKTTTTMVVLTDRSSAPVLGVGDIVVLLVVFSVATAVSFWFAANLDEYALSPMAAGAAGVLAYIFSMFGLIMIGFLVVKLIALVA
jgi:hypothetical protein